MKSMPLLNATECQLNWVAAQVRPNMLKKACVHLENQCFEFFAPSRKETIKSGARFKQVDKLLFPGYVFVKCNIASHDIVTLNATSGLSRVVRGIDAGPGIIPNEFIDELMWACDENTQSVSTLKKGEKVRLIDGPFVGLVGEILSTDANGRLKVLFELMSGARTLSVNTQSVESLS